MTHTADHDPYPGSFPRTPWPGMRFFDDRALPLGTWQVEANGRIFPAFEITDVSSSGVVTGIFNGEAIEEGMWDNGKLSFVRVVATAPPFPLRQRFTGYLMQFDTRDYFWRIAGVYGKLPDNVDDYVDTAGWYATRPRYEE